MQLGDRREIRIARINAVGGQGLVAAGPDPGRVGHASRLQPFGEPQVVVPAHKVDRVRRFMGQVEQQVDEQTHRATGAGGMVVVVTGEDQQVLTAPVADLLQKSAEPPMVAVEVPHDDAAASAHGATCMRGLIIMEQS